MNQCGGTFESGLHNVYVVSRQPHSSIRLAGAGFAGLVLVALLVVIAHSALGFGASDYSFVIENWVYDFVTATSGLVLLARAAVRRDERLGWALLGGGLLTWSIGDTYWSIAYANVAEPPFPSLDDVFYLVGYALVLGGMVAYVRARMGKRSILVWTDVTMGALCVAAICTSLLLDYVLANTTGSPSEIAVAVAYPLFDVATLAVAIGAFALTGWRPGRGLGLVILGLATTATGDAIYTYQSVAGTYTDSAWYLFLWPLGTALIALGALQPSPKRRELAADDGWRAFASPMVFALAIFALMTLQRQDMTRPIVEALTAATLIAIVVRLTLTFVQNHRMVIELETDSLTGLANRGKLLFDLDRFYAGTGQIPHLLAVLDLDGFKAYNDAFGHPAGDSLLIRLGHQLGGAVGSTGRAYRMGGDEFALIVPGDGDEAVGAIQDATAALSERGEGFQITCSAGWAAIPGGAANPGSALQLADQRMYEHKDSRRPTNGGEVEAVLLRILNQRAPELSEHVNAVKSLCLAVGEELDLPPGELAALGRASELHDIGKIAIPDAILTKAGPLDEEEWGFMHQHTILGERIVAAAPSLASVGGLIRSSHERWDGNGYPDRLAGEEIPLAARIILVCDAYDAMTSQRPYSQARGPEAALAEIREHAGTQFDPDLVEVLERVVRSAPADHLPVPVPVA
jgi:two-component system cell cycle response regulator